MRTSTSRLLTADTARWISSGSLPGHRWRLRRLERVFTWWSSPSPPSCDHRQRAAQPATICPPEVCWSPGSSTLQRRSLILLDEFPDRVDVERREHPLRPGHALDAVGAVVGVGDVAGGVLEGGISGHGGNADVGDGRPPPSSSAIPGAWFTAGRRAAGGDGG
jgi:hypothetical protein